jgi:pimeloyl-ACP methyl ester carboxylesterase
MYTDGFTDLKLNGTGHLPNLDKPDEFNKIVLDFCYQTKSE